MSGDLTLDHIRKAQQRVVAQLRADREKRRLLLPDGALLWLALTPMWTKELAERCDFPSGEHGPAAALDEIHELGFCERETATPELTITAGKVSAGPPRALYWMSRQDRRAVVDEAVEQRGLQDLKQTIGDIARRLLDADPPPTVARWAQLAKAAPDEEAMVAALVEVVEPLLENRTGEAMRWVEAARLLQLCLEDRFGAAAERMARRIDLQHRRQDDKRRLRGVLLRDEQAQAFRELLDDRDAWALHYVGSGGFGKTTLVRYITSTLAESLGVITATVDFDFLSPDYPLNEPGELLVRFADELRLHAPSPVAEEDFAAFDEKVQALHDRRRAHEPRRWRRTGADAHPSSGTSAAAILSDPDFRVALDVFAQAVRRLDERVVLILDTCEELARLRPDGDPPATVEVTFGVLGELRRRIPGLCVVFCGRRPLASAGVGWRSLTSAQPARSKLRLHEIRGFVEADARKYLAQMRVRDELLDPILEVTGATDDTSRFAFDNERTGPVLGVRRYNPFELALYARWANDPDDAPSPKAIRQKKVDPYIAVRLVGRLERSIVEEIVPVVALLGRFDRDILSAVGAIAPDRFDDVFRWLVESEWIDPQSGGWYEVQRALRARLLRHLRSKQAAAYAKACDRLAGQLRSYLDGCRVEQLNASHVGALVRLLERDPADAFAWWAELETRLATHDWQFTKELTGLLLSQTDPEAGDAVLPEADDDEGGALEGAILATYAAAIATGNAPANSEAAWAAVTAWVDEHTNSPGADALRLRAMCGRIAAVGDGAADLDALVAAVRAASREGLDDRISGSLAAAIEATVERAEVERRPLPGAWAHLTEMLRDRGGDDAVRAFAWALEARIRLLARDRAAAWQAFAAAVETVPAGPTPHRWLDWRSPDDLWSRIRLELVRAELPVRDTLEVIGDPALVPLTTVEGRWLHAALMRLRLARSWMPPEELDELRLRLLSAPIDHPWANAHFAQLPPQLALAAMLIGSGRVARGVEDVAAIRRRMEAEGSVVLTQVTDTVAHHVWRRMRLRDEGEGAVWIGRPGANVFEQEILWALDGLDGGKVSSLFAPSRATERPTRGEDWPLWRHVRWRGVFAGTAEHARDATSWAALALGHERHAPAGSAALACALDAEEANRVSEQAGVPRPCRAVFAASDVDRVMALTESGEALEALSLLLRRTALCPEDTRAASEVRRLADLLGVRRAANIALDEGELLALRLLEPAMALLARAHDWYRESGDPVGALLARLTALVTLARDGDREGCIRWSRDLDVEYAEVEGLPETGLPPWERVREAIASPSAERLDSMPVFWRPWLVRLIASQVWAADRSTERLSTVATWVATHYGLEGAALSATTESAQADADERIRVPVPAEFDGWLGPAEPPTQSGASDRAAAVRNTAVVVASALAGAVLAVVAARLSEQLPGVGIAWGAFLVLCVAFVAGFHTLIRRSTVLVDVIPHAATSSVGPERGGRYAVRMTAAGPHIFGRRVPSPASMFRVAVVVSLSRSVRGRDRPYELAPMLHALDRLQRWAGRRQMDVALRVASSAAWVPWEALLTPDGKTHSVADLPFRWRRFPDRGRIGPPDEPRRIVSLAGGLSEHAVARAWYASSPDRHEIHRLDDTLSLPPAPEVDVLHVAGRLVETASGVRLAVQPPSQWTPSARGTLLRSADLVARFPRLQLCVLQGVAVPGGHWSSRNRDETSLLRRFAAELAEQEVPNVLTLPPLDRDRSFEMLRAVADTLDSASALTPRRLQRAVEMAQRSIAAGKAPSPDEMETALEVCLYAAGDLLWIYRLARLVAFERVTASRIPGEEEEYELARLAV